MAAYGFGWRSRTFGDKVRNVRLDRQRPALAVLGRVAHDLGATEERRARIGEVVGDEHVRADNELLRVLSCPAFVLVL